MASSMDKLAKELKKQMTASDGRKPKPYDTQAEVLRVEDGVAWVHIPGGVDETPVRLTINAKKGDNVNLHVANGTAWITGNSTNPPTDDSTANYAVNISNEVKKEVTVLHTTVVDAIEATDARFKTVEADTAKIHTLTAEKILATVGYIDDLTAEEITVQDLTAASGYIKDLEANNITAQDISASSGYIKDLEADNITAQDISAASGYIKDLEADNITAQIISAATGFIDDLITGNVTAQNVIADHATVGSLDTNYAHINNGVIDNAKINYADVNNLSTNYAQINLANVNNAWIENGVVKDAAISDAQIIGVSANKLTAGTIDASNITVTNLNASNITTGSITVDGITIDVENNEASIDGSHIEDGTITMNGFAQEVKDVIDGAIETFTGTVVPTLNNAPANAWTTTKLKDQHIGDVYYVVNASSKQNGYCYRFSKSGSTYSWQLIKDSDVTAALQRLQTAEGKISNIESFDEEMATFKTETEGEISTLQTKTTNLETSLGDKVDKTVFNEVKQTVDGNSASITELSTITTNNGLTKTTNITNTVNTVSQTAAGNSSKISSLTNTLGTNADGTTKAGDIVHQVSQIDQDLDGVTTRVSKTEVKLAGQYATSSTAAGTAAKVATIVPTLSGYELAKGAMVTVKFTTANTAASPTLNLNSTGAKAIKTYSGGNLTEAEYKWKAGSTFTFTYNGTNWLMQDSTASVRMNSAETEISQNAAQIALRAKSSDVYTKEQVYTKTQTDSAITQRAGEISLEVAQTEIANIEVGGRNYVKDSQDIPLRNKATSNSDYYTLTVYHNDTAFEIGDVLTASANVEVLEGSVSSIDFYLRGKSAETYRDKCFIVTADIVNGKAVAKLTLTKHYGEDGNKDFNLLIYQGVHGQTAGNHIKLTNVKLEKGNKATDWSPAPEDLENYADGAVATAKAEIKVTTDSISTEVSKKVGNNEVISKINQSPEEITIDASRVNIAGAAIFSNYATTAQLNSEVNARKAVYATSSTAAGTKAKVADCSNFALYTGASVAVTFSNANTHATPTLNVNGTGAKNIKGYTGAALTEAEYKWIANSTVTFTYDGTNWRMQDGGALQAKAAAAASASTASTKASEASTSATNAATSASTASSKASEASTSATNAASSASTASSKASSASISATNAATSASTASTKASEASTSATNAATSASTASTKASEAATSATAAAEVMGGFTILWNYENFSTANNGEGYICAFDPKTGSKSDANGWVKWNGTKRTISKQMINPNTILPYNIPIYVVCRLSSATATTGTNYLVWYKSGWKYAALPTPTAVGGDWTWTEATDIILGKFAEPSSEEAFTDCEIYNPPRSSKHITTNTVTAGSAQATANAAAPKSSAVAEEQYIYISKASGTTSVSGTTTWITETGDKQNTWTTKRPTYNSSYPVLFVAKQKKVVSGTVTCTTPVKDDTTTVIDGGHITTGTIDTNRLNADTIKVNAANIQGSLTIGQLPSTVAETSDIPTKVSELSNDSGYQTSSQVSSAINNVRSWYATCSTAAGTAAKVATITPTTTAFTTSVLTAGTLVNVKFTVTNTAAVGDLTLNINNTGAKHIKTLRHGVINNIAGAGYLAKDTTYQFTYDGTYWVMQENYNSDTQNRIRWQNVIAAAEAITAGHIICGTASGYRDIAANVSFDMAYPLLYAATAIAKGATSGTRDNNFLEINGINASVNGTITSGAANKILFLKGTLTGNTFKISASPFLTTVVPTSQDNLCYIPLGIMYSATNIYFKSSDQIYAYKDGAFGPISMREASAAAKTATTYITHIDNNGIRVHPSSTQNNSVVINASGMEVFKGGTDDKYSVAKYGDTVRIGKDASEHIYIGPGSFSIGKGVNNANQYMNVFMMDGRIPDGTTITGAYYAFTNMGSSVEPPSDSLFGFMLGYYCEATGFCTKAMGEGIVVHYDHQTAIGKYNENDSANAFEIGWGTDNTPKNIFAVKTDGTVEISGSSMTDFVIEQGNGYRKWNSGLAECWVHTAQNVALKNAYGSLYQGTWTWKFPITFNANPAVTCSHFKWGTGGSWGTIGGVSTTAATLRGFDTYSRAAGTCDIAAYAIGRWK